MSAIAPPVGLVQLSAPLPQARSYSLLDAARETPQATERWLGGISTEGFVPAPASVHDPCSSGTDRIKDDANDIPVARFGAFTVYLPGSCGAVSVGPNPSVWEDRLRLAFQAYEAAAVETVLLTGAGFTGFGPYIQDANLEVLSAVAVSPIEGLDMLETEIATVGGGGMIHCTPGMALYWESLNLLRERRGTNVKETKLGTPVAVGAGYIAGAATTSDTEEWAYATGPVEYMRTVEPLVMPADYAQALDRSNNRVLFIAERDYVLNWVGRTDPTDDLHTQASVLIDTALCSCLDPDSR